MAVLGAVLLDNNAFSIATESISLGRLLPQGPRRHLCRDGNAVRARRGDRRRHAVGGTQAARHLPVGRRARLPHADHGQRAHGGERRVLRQHRAREMGDAAAHHHLQRPHDAVLPGRARGVGNSRRGREARLRDFAAGDVQGLRVDREDSPRPLQEHRRALPEREPHLGRAVALRGPRLADVGFPEGGPRDRRGTSRHGQDVVRAEPLPAPGAQGEDTGRDLQPRNVGRAARDATVVQRGARRFEQAASRIPQVERVRRTRDRRRLPGRSSDLHRRLGRAFRRSSCARRRGG